MSDIATPNSITYTSQPLSLTAHPRELTYTRADLEFHGLDHSGWSYEGAVFINNSAANEETDRTVANGYAGSFHIFGHGGCYGNEGHCDIPTKRRDFDMRSPHPLEPIIKRVNATAALRQLLPNGGDFTVTVVASVQGGGAGNLDVNDHFLKFEKIRLVTYRP